MRRKNWPRHGGLGLGLGVGGGGVGYLLNDSFLTDKAAGAVNGTAAEPGPGTRLVVDTGSDLSISGGDVVCAGGTGGWGDPRIVWDSIARTSGRIIVFSILQNVLANFQIGLFSATTGALAGRVYVWGGGTSTGAGVYDGLTSGAFANFGAADGTYQKLAYILRTTGCYFFVKGTNFTKWSLAWISSNANTTPLFPCISIADATYEATFNRVPTLLWTPRPISADAFGGAWPTTDGGGLTGLEAGGSGKTWTTAVGATWSNAGGFAVNAPGVGDDLVTDGGFENWAGVGDLTSWTESIAGTSTLLESADVHGGAKSVAMYIDAAKSAVYFYQQLTVSAGQWVRHSVWAKGAGGNFRFCDGSANNLSSPYVPGVAYTKYSATERLLTNNPNRGTKRDTGLGDTTIYFDDYKVEKLAIAELIQVIDNGVEDIYAEIDITAVAGFQAGIVFNYTDASNFEVVYLNRNDSKVYWDQCVAGTYTNINTSAAVTPGSGYKLAVRRIGTSLYYWYNNIYVHNNTIVSGLNTTSQGLFSTGNGATEVKFDNWKLYAVGSGGEYSLLDMFCN